MSVFRIKIPSPLRLPNSLGKVAARLAPIGNLGLTKLSGSSALAGQPTQGDSVRIFPNIPANFVWQPTMTRPAQATPLLDAARAHNTKAETLVAALSRHLPEVMGNFMEMIALLTTIGRVQKLMGEMGDSGRANFAAYRQIADQFNTIEDRLQFLASRPEVLPELLRIANYPDAFFTDIGTSKKEFLDFMGFTAASHLDYTVRAAARAASNVRDLPPDAEPYRVEALTRFRDTLIARAHNPSIFLFSQLMKSAKMLAELLTNKPPQTVQFAIEHPHYMWINHVPTPDRFIPNNPKYGKWVINTDDIRRSFELVQRLLPYFATEHLGTLKFEQRPKNGRLTVITYAQDHDPAVFDIVRTAAGRDPFWVTDEFCHEAEGILRLIQHVTPQLNPTQSWEPTMAETLRDRAVIAAIGMSEIQAEILWRLLHADDAQYQNSDTDYAHIINGYFGDDEVLSAEVGMGTGKQSDHLEGIKLVLMHIFDAGHHEDARTVLEDYRKQFGRAYDHTPKTTSPSRQQ